MPASSDPNSLLAFGQWLWTVLLVPFGLLFKKTGDNAKEIAGHKQHVAESYVPKEDYRMDMRDIKDDLKTIIQKIDRKADK